MEKMKMAMAMGAVMVGLSACGQTGDFGNTTEISEENPQTASGEDETDSYKGGSYGYDVDAELEHLIGEYDYLWEDGTGKLAIEKTSYGYDISDYESESSYRFLADSSNIETIEDNRIYMKYPEQIFSDGTAVFGYYILEYGTDEINVYYGKSSYDETEFLYHATKNMEAGTVTNEYEGEYLDSDMNEPALKIKKNDDGTYQIQITVYRLCFLDDGIGKKTENGLEFAATGPDGNEVKGLIQLDGDTATVTFFGQEWLDFAGLSEYTFYKTADVPDRQDAADAGMEASTDKLLDSFVKGSISAAYSTDLTSEFYITDLNMDSGEWDAYSVGEKVDLDNDGENELIICGPYGGMYLDVRDNKVYKFAGGDGTALVLSYTYYNGEIWIMYSNRSSAGFEYYHMEKFEGADNLAAEMNFGEEFDTNHPEAGIKYTLNDSEISYDEYTELCSKIFAAEVSTN